MMRCKAAVVGLALLLGVFTAAVSGAPAAEPEGQAQITLDGLTVTLDKAEDWTLRVREGTALLAAEAVYAGGRQKVALYLPDRSVLVVYFDDTGIVAVRS